MVLVLEDLSELLAAQRAAAWSEVARRMAHEIKNPLTPIQLSAERIARTFTRASAASKTSWMLSFRASPKLLKNVQARLRAKSPALKPWSMSFRGSRDCPKAVPSC
ncbi:MAG: hypothetical protein WKF84_12875 [Pyrinomonadaceae bacterium]